ncbi:hypothetical protein TPHA_0D02580 [Tetrapisispora phaffii CBS 4417]|uniref:DUF676 domain-containing protein n=1 Tax=Tetrapisispora phaffii (strain ATCC 24235 / CBS 4417 / NBRC 1672 / NRRL Y-8282 / UCD 70-5) TaxID=1071381 RepID=G8BSS4_TETPH|nr:hypothetical protein TPHA_0D02580 [Tetrapisispora phaffii CBS 4417]CCE62895.1 hypothetical protein TPHA_0D02580 [Tetrapisispora phaffii CBS 4417]
MSNIEVENEQSSSVVAVKSSLVLDSSKSTNASISKKDVITEKIMIYNVSNVFSIGDVMRFRIDINKKKLFSYFGINDEHTYLEVIVKNKENPMLRPLYIAGPYAVYTDIRPHNYNENIKFNTYTGQNNVVEDIQYTGDLKPDETFKGILLMNPNSKVDEDENYGWTVDILSQIAVTTLLKLDISMKIRIITEKLRRETTMSFNTNANLERNQNNSTSSISKMYYKMKDRVNSSLKTDNIIDPHKENETGFRVISWDTDELWNLMPKYEKKPVHLVLLTHGIFSNIGCDMLYIKDKIEEMTYNMDEEFNPNVVIRGCMENMGKSSHGVYKLGVTIGEYIVKEVKKLNDLGYNINKISFIGHSLGGLTQSMAIHYISVIYPDFFDPVKGIKPVNFITMASPMIGMPADFPKYVTLALDFGALGITGRDLTLKNTPWTSKTGIGLTYSTTTNSSKKKLKSILEILPQPPARSIFERFINRTLYANIVHDGIVPLKTAALLYLDWQGLNRVKLLKDSLDNTTHHDIAKISQDTTQDDKNNNAENNISETKSNMAEIPDQAHDKKAALQWLAPLGLTNSSKYRSYERTQTIVKGEKKDGLIELEFKPPPTASPALAALSVLTSAEPSQEYIRDPSKRTDAIIHDKIYSPDELPPRHYQGRSIIKKIIHPNERINRAQERIARSWQETMIWRKVLVNLKPDSHNNIVVRRRFLNLFGNVAVMHMVNEHFGVEACKTYAKIE